MVLKKFVLISGKMYNVMGIDQMLSEIQMSDFDLLDDSFQSLFQNVFTEKGERLKENLIKVELEEVLQRILDNHRDFLSKYVPEIEQTMNNFLLNSEENNSLGVRLMQIFNIYKEKLVQHIKAEESDLLPYIHKLVEARKGRVEDVVSLLENCTLDEFEEKHDDIENGLFQVTNLIRENSHQLPKSYMYSIFLNQINMFEIQLRNHAILEDHILVPRTHQLREELKSLTQG